METVLRWASDGGLEQALRSDGTHGPQFESVVIGTSDDGTPFAATYLIACDVGWRTREATVRVVGRARRLHLRSDGNGHWQDGGDKPLPELGGCLDVDLTATPLTNTLALRRLALGDGGTAVIRVVHVRLPELTMSASEQRYTRRSQREYRFELTDSSFVRDITVDAEGFVLDYPGLFRRVRPQPTADGAPDDDLSGMSPAQLAAEVRRLRQGIRSHRDSTGHELCWHHPALWGLLPEKTDPRPAVPDWPQFMQGCIRYRQSLDRQLPHAPRTAQPPP